MHLSPTLVHNKTQQEVQAIPPRLMISYPVKDIVTMQPRSGRDMANYPPHVCATGLHADCQ